MPTKQRSWPKQLDGYMYIYSLADPFTNEVRYVGATKNPRDRFYNHLAPSQAVNDQIGEWIAEIRRAAKLPIFAIYELVEASSYEECERFYIEQERAKGSKLFNVTSGGRSGCTLDGLSDRDRAYRSAYTAPTLNKYRARAIEVNIERMRAITHCVRGHEYNETNTRIVFRRDGTSYRRCKICGKLKTREYRAAKRQSEVLVNA